MNDLTSHLNAIQLSEDIAKLSDDSLIALCKEQKLKYDSNNIPATRLSLFTAIVTGKVDEIELIIVLSGE